MQTDTITDREAIELLRKAVGKKDLAVCKRAAAKDPEKFIPMLREAGFVYTPDQPNDRFDRRYRGRILSTKGPSPCDATVLDYLMMQ